MKITKVVTVTCCGKCKTFDKEYQAVDYLLNHIRRSHKGLLKQLDARGRVLAKSQNGCGYYDGNGEGWRRAKRKNPNFVSAWTKHALERRLRIAI